MTRLHFSFKLLFLLFLVVLSWWLLERSQVATPLPAREQSSYPDAFMKEFVATTMGSDGTPKYRLQATSLNHYSLEDRSELEAPKITLFQRDAAPWYLEAEQGLVYNKLDKVFLLGQVYMHHRDKKGQLVEVFTSNMELRPESQYAATEFAVLIKHVLDEKRGMGMQADLGKAQFALLASVRGRYEFPEVQ
ncbi:MAG: LPS export ABC transporter periplasmic protein LptC [Gammaproteobacteria bacterium]|nr:LPS export ABC transporter periplasmic protein LptC [Gammaproteobacteria bacterium]